MIARRLALVLVLVAVSLSAQRRPLRGSVELPDGSPWVGASVLLLSRPIPADERLGEADVVHAVSDAEGRFRVMLLRGRQYTAWAVESADAGDRVSHAVDGVTAGTPLMLVADGDVRPRAKVELVGLEAWRGRELQCRLLSRSHNVIVAPCEPPVDGVLTLPPLPGGRAALEVLAGGLPLENWPVAIDLRATRTQKVTLDAPRRVLFRFVDAAKKPVAGARLFQSTLDNWAYQRALFHPLGASDADGYLVAELPIGRERDFSWANYTAHAIVPGFAPIGWIYSLKIPKTHDASLAGGPAYTFKAGDGARLQAAVTLGGEPLADLSLLVRTPAVSTEGGSIRHIVWPAQTDAAGKWELWGEPRFNSVLAACPAPAVLEQMPSSNQFPTHPVIALGVAMPPVADPHDFGTFDLARLPALDLQVLAPDGSPAVAPRVAIGLSDVDGIPSMVLRDVATDRLGRVRVFVPHAESLVVCSWSAAGSAVRQIDFRRPRAEPLTMKLRAVRALPGRVTDADGRGLARAEVVFFVYARDMRTAEPGVLGRALGTVRVRAEVDGRFRVPLYDGLTYSFSRIATPDDDHYPKKVPQFTAGGEDLPELLEIRLGR